MTTIPGRTNARLASLIAEAKEIGKLEQRLNDCGPQGNRSVENELYRRGGRLEVLTELVGGAMRAGYKRATDGDG